ncbi:MAG: acylneuraminate cytidylyltransferase family protein [Pegethrix bostrychoides GSE-TBD4-15B]|uniref:Acylneuraminate cytidylyltransferase family protein n=1 Tax=Pegethrix bostrychoides GSE-TBD4-15B TaxID=2839662 RepID=A0A951U328_9CYAN|nr:acylneuraminate cytidylyltransferase family protein [Pegethrix bostrychoides GSE-TBD4-15B]
MSKPRIVALVPMRHSSERVPGKNYRDFAGTPLYHRIIDNLVACPLVDQVVIDTDSSIIHEDAARHFPSVKLLHRPKHLQAGTVPMNDVLLNAIQQIDADFYLQTHSTNPLLRSETITQAVQAFLDNYPMYDSLFGVTRLQTRLWDGLAKAINHNPAILLRTQDLPPVYEENSCLYIFTQKILTTHHNRIGNRPFMFEIEKLEAVDIDEEADYCIAELLYQRLQNQSLTHLKVS